MFYTGFTVVLFFHGTYKIFMAHIGIQTNISMEEFNFSICDLTLVMLNIFIYYTSPLFYPANLQHISCICKHAFSITVENIVDPDQMASSQCFHFKIG